MFCWPLVDYSGLISLLWSVLDLSELELFESIESLELLELFYENEDYKLDSYADEDLIVYSLFSYPSYTD